MTTLEFIVCLLPLAVVLGIFAFIEIRCLIRWRHCTHSVNAEIGNLTECYSFGRRGRSLFRPMVQYTFNGQRYWEEARHKYTYDTYTIGQPVTIYVDPDDPSVFCLSGERRKALLELCVPLVIIGICITVLAFKNAEYTRAAREREQILEAIMEDVRNNAQP